MHSMNDIHVENDFSIEFVHTKVTKYIDVHKK